VKDRCEALIQAKAAEPGRHLAALEIMSDHEHLFVKAHPLISSAPRQSVRVSPHPAI